MKRRPASLPRTIRTALPTEAEALSNLALRSKAFWGYSDAFMDACRSELTYSADQIASDTHVVGVAEVDGLVVGFYVLTTLSADAVELDALFVEPDAIGNGHGRALMDHAARVAAQNGATSLTIQSDPNAADFYRACGGVCVGERRSASISGRTLPLFRIDLSQRLEA